MKRFILLVCVLGLAMGMMACSDDDDEIFNNDDPNDSANNDDPNNQPNNDDPNNQPNNDDPNNQPNNQSNNNDDTCEPVTCEEINQECGVVDDGCDGELDCGECACTENDFLDTCPTRPCEQVVGCGSGECEYEPIEASDGTTCTECPGGDCGNTTVRYCNYDDDDVCPQYYCDPDREVDDAGRTIYNNEVLDSYTYDCGTCNLGYQVCDAGSFSCDDIEVDNVDPEFAECDDTQTGSTFLYVDASYTGSSPDGSQDSPYATIDTALVAANQRNAEAIILGGSSVFNESVELRSGISIIGGYDARPSWTRNPDQEPVIRGGASDMEGQLVVGMRGQDITDTTHIKNVRVETEDVADLEGVSTAALMVDNASGLKLDSVVLEAGAAGAGADGDHGSNSSSTGGHGADGIDGESFGGGGHLSGSYLFTTEQGTWAEDMPEMTAAGTNPDCPDADGGQGARGNDRDPNDIAQHNDMHLPGENSAAGHCENAYGSTDNPLYDSDNECGGRRFESGSTEYADMSGRDGLPHSGVAADGDDGLSDLSFDGGGLTLMGHGEDGETGEAGRGGGGGVSGHGRYDGGSDQYYLGANGGGGGAGGCGGEGGEGGFAGGWSMGLVAQATSDMSMVDVEIIAGDAGDGGLGGEGGEGAVGGTGGSGGDQTSNQSGWGNEGDGSDGGDGSTGQTGGSGGAGAGGSSVAIFCPESDVNFESEGTLQLVTNSAGASAGQSGMTESNLNCTVD